jgi:hypothetical protein
LSSKKSDIGPKKGKDAEMARWDADIRNSLANKKAAATTKLSKQDQILVEAQLEKESIVRQRVDHVKVDLLRGLQLVRSLVLSDVQEFRSYISTVASLLLDGALGKGSVLIGNDGVQTYLVMGFLIARVYNIDFGSQDLAKCCSERLDTFRFWVGVATLRSLDVQAMPENLEAEPLNRSFSCLHIQAG